MEAPLARFSCVVLAGFVTRSVAFDQPQIVRQGTVHPGKVMLYKTEVTEKTRASVRDFFARHLN